MRGPNLDIKKFAVLTGVVALTLAGCAAGADSDAGETASTETATTETESAAPANSDIKICVYTHGDGGTFWSVAQAGAEKAGEDLGITIDYQGSINDSAKQAATIEGAVSAGCSGVAASAPDPGAIEQAMLAVAGAGIPTVTMNSGSAVFKDLGAFTHVGQDEIVAGREAGLRFNELGATNILCPIQEAANVGLTERCQGARETSTGTVTDFNLDGGLQDLTAASAKIKAALEADPSIDAIFALNADIAAKAALPAAQELGRDLFIGTVDMSEDALNAIAAGEMVFAIDQQQYAQGYLSVVLLYLNVTNAHSLGGGLPMYTGPGFVDASNVEEVIGLVAAGTR
jgi:simple sugar transport system substrate-binding protein